MAGVRLGINRLVGDTVGEAQSIEDTGKTEVIECGLVLRSIGYQGRDSIPTFLPGRVKLRRCFVAQETRSGPKIPAAAIRGGHFFLGILTVLVFRSANTR